MGTARDLASAHASDHPDLEAVAETLPRGRPVARDRFRGISESQPYNLDGGAADLQAGGHCFESNSAHRGKGPSRLGFAISVGRALRYGCPCCLTC